MLSFILGGCGTGKSTVLLERLRRDLEAGHSVTVLVPEQFSFEEEKKLYSALGPALFNRLETRSFATLSRQILETCAGNAGRSYATEQEKLLYLYLAVQECLHEGRFRSLAKRFGSHEFLAESFSMINKLRRAGVSGDRLIELSEGLPDVLRDKTHDLGQLLYAYDHVLLAHGRRDSLADLTEAAALAQMHYYFEGCRLYLDEFDSFTGDQYQLLAVCLEQAENITAAIRADLPDEAPSGIFAGGVRTYQNLRRMAQESGRISVEVTACREYRRSSRSDLRAVSGCMLPHHPGRGVYDGNVHLFAAADAAGEAEYICAAICELLSADTSLRCRDIAIALKEESYEPLFIRAMQRYALPYDLAAPRPIYHTELVRYFLTLLALMTENTPHTETLLRYAKSPLSGYSLESASMLEHYCFTWSVEGAYWHTPFGEEEALAEEMEQQFDIGQLEQMRSSLMDTVATLQEAAQTGKVRRICRTLYTHLEASGQRYTATLDPLRRQEFVTVWNLLCECMDTVVQCLGETTLSVKELSDSFRLLLQSTSFSTPPQTLDSVRIVRAATARLNAPKVVFVPGFCTGVYPADVSISGFFTGQELEQLEEHTGLTIARLLPELHSDELLILNKLLSAPSEALWLTWPAVRINGESCLPSPAADTILQLFRGSPELLQHEQQMPLHYYIRTPESAYYHFVRRFRDNTGETAAVCRILCEDPAYAQRVQRLVHPQPQDALRVSGQTMQALLGEQLLLSPSGIDQFFHCPFAYFCSRCLKLYDPERVALSAQKIGSFSHYCLEQVLLRYTPEQFVCLTQQQLREEIDRLSAAFSTANFTDAVRRDGRFQLNYHMTGQSILPLLLHLQQELQESRFQPAAFEVPVDHTEGALPPLTLDDGRIVCRGRIDRVDLCRMEGRSLLRVVDYKTGRKFFSPEKLAEGLDMQMLIYLFALKRGGAFEGAQPSGVFYSPSGQLRRFDDRSTSARQPQEILDEHFRMKGLMLDTAAPLMESGLAEAAVPVLEGAGSKLHLYSVTQAQMQQVEQSVEHNIRTMARRLYSGEVAPSPCLHDEYSPCGFCGYADICGSAVQDTVKQTAEEAKMAIQAVFGHGKEDEDA